MCFLIACDLIVLNHALFETVLVLIKNILGWMEG